MSRPVPSGPTWRVAFPDLPCGVALAGVTPVEARRVAGGWCGAISRPSAGKAGAPYTIRCVQEPIRTPRRTRRAGMRVVPGRDEERIVLPWGEVRVAPGRREALVHRASGRRPAAAIGELLSAALTHALAAQGMAMVHAAAFRAGDDGVLALGAGFSGKSTLTAAALRLGARAVSDDLVAVGRDGAGEPVVRTLCRDVHVRGASADVLPPALRRRLVKEPGLRPVRWRLPRTAAPGVFARSVAPTVVVHLRLDRRLGGFRVRPLSHAGVLAALIGAASPLYLTRRYERERDAVVPLLVEVAERARGFEAAIGGALLTDPDATAAALFEALGVAPW